MAMVAVLSPEAMAALYLPSLSSDSAIARSPVAEPVGEVVPSATYQRTDAPPAGAGRFNVTLMLIDDPSEMDVLSPTID